MGVGQALSVPIVDPSRYQKPLMGAVGTRRACLALYHGFFGDLGDTHLLACQWSGWREISVELTILFPYFPIFTTCVQNIIIYLPFDIERAWLTRSVVLNTLIHFDFYAFLADTRATIHIGAILLASILYYYI